MKKRREICPEEGEDTNTASATEESTPQTISPGAVGHDVTINGFLRSLQELVVKSEPNFKSLKVIEQGVSSELQHEESTYLFFKPLKSISEKRLLKISVFSFCMHVSRTNGET